MVSSSLSFDFDCLEVFVVISTGCGVDLVLVCSTFSSRTLMFSMLLRMDPSRANMSAGVGSCGEVCGGDVWVFVVLFVCLSGDVPRVVSASLSVDSTWFGMLLWMNRDLKRSLKVELYGWLCEEETWVIVELLE